MGSRAGRARRALKRFVALATTVALLTSLTLLVAPGVAYADGGALAVSTTSYSAGSPPPGAPVTYTMAVDVGGGSDTSNSRITMVHATPPGVLPLGAFGTGWGCQSPVGQSITCVTTNNSFNNGTKLTLTVVAIVTGSGMTSSVIQNSSTTTVSVSYTHLRA